MGRAPRRSGSMQQLDCDCIEAVPQFVTQLCTAAIPPFSFGRALRDAPVTMGFGTG